MKILDNLAIKIADKVNAHNDEVMLLTQENDTLKQKLAASELTVSDYQKKINASDKKVDSFRGELEFKVKQLKNLNSELDRIKNNYDELSKKKTSKESKKQITKLKQVNANQLRFIEILQTIASAKSDKTQLKDVFSHNLSIYLDNNFSSVKQASDKLGINRTTLSELKTGKIALSYDNLDILDSKLCEYFECSVYELVTEKMEGKK
ncbi:helix-turn-helix domain-containing protein [Vagococcus fluvialis]|uniref:HTH cro/C1-type domain-containing protein n=1 Tax=Vagococcus fluvialis TaxID=2738 RepID=A0A7X6D7D4_9ENTE|nr:helix-turn-helix transcriptional regulator [Vagococcus fluvialis]NKC67201.1 hypothetical protein [Vagococcus fluvialis]